MRGIVRPCRNHLGPELHERWRAHLCGLCLTLREEAGQPERALTGYDVLLLSVLVEAQAGPLPTTQAGPCPLRAFRPATVVSAWSGGAQFAAAGALLAGGAGLDDKLADAELPRPVRRPAAAAAVRLQTRGRALARRTGFDPAPVLRATAEARAAEVGSAQDLGSLLAPSGRAVAALFAHTAVVAGMPDNAAALARCGDAFGRLVHLLDAVEDVAADAAGGRFNPLIASATPPEQARELADSLAVTVQVSLSSCALVDPALAQVLLDREVDAAVRRTFHVPSACPTEQSPAVPAQRGSGLGALVAAWTVLAPAVIIGGWGSSGGGRRRRGRYRRGYDPYDGYGYGPRRGGGCGGPSCGQVLACNCCANALCNGCCCDCGDV